MQTRHYRLVAVIAASLTISAAAADDFAIQTYLAIPFGNEGSYWGLRASSDQRLFEIGGVDEVAARAAQVDLRFGEPNRSSVLINGVAIDPVLDRLWADGSAGSDTEDADSVVDWYQVAGILLGVGLIAAVINADDGAVVACTGANCELEPESPPEPEPADAAEGG